MLHLVSKQRFYRCAPLIVAGCTGFAAAEVRFTDAAALSGIEPYSMAMGMGGGVAAADYDNDGDVDMFVPCAPGLSHQLYRNRGDGVFDEVAEEVGLGSTDSARVALWLDYDGDQDLDLLVAGDYWFTEPTGSTTLRLYRQESDGMFTDVSTESGIADDYLGTNLAHQAGMAAADLNNDGFVDVIVGTWRSDLSLLMNNGDGTFSNEPERASVARWREHWQPVIHDFNRDGWLDVFFAVDFTDNLMLLNNGNGTFREVAATVGVDNAWNEMGVSLGDFDGDLDFDIYVTNIYDKDFRHNLLYRNDSVGESLKFIDVARDYHVGDSGWGWGCSWFDVENDGDVDIAATNGFLQPPYNNDESVLFVNDNGSFVNVARLVGYLDNHWGSSVIAIDVERDGDLDLVQTCNQEGPLRLFHNTSTDVGSWITIRPRMGGTNHFALGAEVVVTSDNGTSQIRLITAGTSFLGQEPAEAHFGLGDAAEAERVVIRWPGGRETVVNHLAANQVHTVTLALGDMNCDGQTTVGDVNGFVLALTDPAAYADAYPLCEAMQADINFDGATTVADINGFIAALTE